ncbi:hypothetical protein H5410_032869 [Solanum commersonii]|uniref:Uncharacterized protein n=1 Tax=Solanum commersonii TaxID=4109 RepID=A0A9J5YL61_SOLCO|nr:hypothetical protein H5410_032869 [Solanum commersonii]
MAFKKINDVSCNDSTIATLVDLSDAGLVSLHKFRTSGLDRSEYFTYLEMARKIKSQMTLKTAIPGGNIASKLFDELSHSDFNFALKKSIDDKNLQIAQLMSKLDLYNSRESHHNLTTQEKVDIDSPTKPVDSQSTKRSALEKIMTLEREGKIIIDDAKTAEINHASVKLDHKKYSISEVLCPVVSPKIEEGVIRLQFGSFEPVEVSALKKTTNTSKIDDFSNEESSDTWTLVALKRQKHQGTSKLRLSKVDKKSSTNQLQQCESIKSNTKSKYINASLQKVRRTITLMEFFLEMLLDVRA